MSGFFLGIDREKIFFVGPQIFFGHSFDVETSYLSICEVFGRIGALYLAHRSGYIIFSRSLFFSFRYVTLAYSTLIETLRCRPQGMVGRKLVLGQIFVLSSIAPERKGLIDQNSASFLKRG